MDLQQSIPLGSTPCFFLVGATAIGKTAVAHVLARRLGQPILSADSMLVYRGMDIGTAKPSDAERAGIRYHGIDLVEPSADFSVWDFRQYVDQVLFADGPTHVPTLVVGGSGLYIKSMTHGLEARKAPDEVTWARLEAVLDRDGIPATMASLERSHPELHSYLVGKENRRRLIRAMAIAESGGTDVPSDWKAAQPVKLVGLTMEKTALWKRVERRTRTMYAMGLVDETQALVKTYGTLSRTARQAIGYAEALGILDGTMKPGDAVERTVIRTRQLVKKQGTWFRTQADVDWITVEDGMEPDAIAELVLGKWNQYGPFRLSRLLPR